MSDSDRRFQIWFCRRLREIGVPSAAVVTFVWETKILLSVNIRVSVEWQDVSGLPMRAASEETVTVYQLLNHWPGWFIYRPAARILRSLG